MLWNWNSSNKLFTKKLHDDILEKQSKLKKFAIAAEEAEKVSKKNYLDKKIKKIFFASNLRWLLWLKETK